jgi:hypothetical protein
LGVVGWLSRYSLVNDKEGIGSHSMHSVLHRWCGNLAEGEKQHKLGCLAVELVARNVYPKSDTEFWRKRKRVMIHGLRVSAWIVEEDRLGKQGAVEVLIHLGSLHNRGYLLEEENRQRAAQMYQRALQGKEKAWGLEHTSTLSTVNNLGVLYANLGRLDEAEKMYQQALQGYEKVWGPEYTSTLNTVNNLGILYAILGWLDKAEKMYRRALAGYAKVISPDQLMTYVPALNNMWTFAILRESQGRAEDARHWYSQALRGYEKTFGQDHSKCLPLRNKLADVARQEKARDALADRVSTPDQTSVQTLLSSRPPSTRLVSKRHRLLTKLWGK